MMSEGLMAVDSLREFREMDMRARRMVDCAVVHALGECRGEVDDAQRFAHDVAQLATTALLKMVYENDAEIGRLRIERDHWKRLAERGLNLVPIGQFVIPRGTNR